MPEKIIEELSEEQQESWEKKVKKIRWRIIKAPADYVHSSFAELRITKEELANNISGTIYRVRTLAWEKYIVDERAFFQKVIAELIENEKDPNDILKACLDKYTTDKLDLNNEKNVAEFIAEFDGRIMPYLYNLSLSVTNSRRSRAGTTFEQIIYKVMEILELPFVNQAKLGKNGFESIELTKKVDMLIPNKETYLSKRTKCHIVTMKTSLRERWQEVVEEMSRTNILHMFLFTLDENINTSGLATQNKHNITIVTYKRIKDRFSGYNNIISFEDYFGKELPNMLKSLN